MTPAGGPAGPREPDPAAAGPREPPADCARCPRLAALRAENRLRFPDFFNAPVPAVGSASPALLVVGLAPGLRGGNRTGIPFQGDGSGSFLQAALQRRGLTRPGAPELRITNAVRCVPPGNRPVAAEFAACRTFLEGELAETRPRVVLALGRLAHEAVLAAAGRLAGIALRPSDRRFAHGARHDLPAFVLFDSYHPSRQNTRTGRLTEAMMDGVLGEVAGCAASAPPPPAVRADAGPP
jgi:uracil-DNA glycosylase